MKTLLFSSAIVNRFKVKFLYGMNEILLEPYYISRNINGKKIIYGKINGSKEIKTYEYEKITNIKILRYEKFSPIIPIVPLYY